MPKITFPTTIGTLSENLGQVLDAYFASTAASINASARYRGVWLGTMDVKAHDQVIYNGALWDALVDSVSVAPVEGASWRQVLAGTGAVLTTLGDTLYGAASGAATRLPGNTTATRKYLSQTGTGSASAAPAWNAIAASDLPAGGTISGYDSTNGQDFKTYQIQELVTVAASATTTTTITVPAGCTVRAVALRVTTAIPTATTFDIGVVGATTRYGAALSTAAGTTNVTGGSVNPSCYASTVALTITPNATPASNTGRVRVVIWYELATAPTS